MRRSLLLLALWSMPTFALEGKWTPDQLRALDPTWLREVAGLEIPGEMLWDGEKGLLSASIKVGGCSAGVVSAAGLVVTNHHCAFGAIQQHATPERDLIALGYLAKNRGEELPGAELRATVPLAFHDVTARVEGELLAIADDLERARRLDLLRAQLVDECEQRPNRHCALVVHDSGVQYVLAEAIEYADVRLVYAPPRAVGEYGGEIDNWSWPRHTGDFAVLRVWTAPDGSPAPFAAENIPWVPPAHFAVSTDGVALGSPVVVTGYPGITFRSLVADEAANEVDGRFATRARIYRDWIALMEAAGAGNDAARIALASRQKTLANREKNARGQLEAIERWDILATRRAAEAEVLAWAASKAPAVAEAHAGLVDLARQGRASLDRDRLLAESTLGPLVLEAAVDIVRFATERAKPDGERRDRYRDRDRSERLDDLRVAGRRLHPPTEAALIADLARRAAALPAGQRIEAFAGLEVEGAAEKIVLGSVLFDDTTRVAMLDETPAQLAARRDPLLTLAFALEAELEAKRLRDDRDRGAALRLRPTWRRGMAQFLGRPVDPDANSSLRVSFAHVAGYSPRDGVRYTPQTTLKGLLAKNTGADPFNAPAAIVTAAADPDRRALWNDAGLADVPVAFLADADTTGGNSGSPVLDAKGRLVGLNFDRVWENIANDFGYVPAIARNVSVDIRYLLWVLDAVEGKDADWLLRELGLEPRGRR